MKSRGWLVPVVLVLLAGCASQPPPPPPAESSVEAPAVDEGRVPSAGGVPIHYRAEGTGEPALVFVHGGSCDGGYWRH
jgi:hypothetical protein